jgi:myo-inositol-1(or 4)-monophosphatase
MLDVQMINNWIENAGKMAIDFFAKPSLGFEFKHDNTIVTEADYSIEKYLREKIRKHYPNHSIIGEEYDHELGSEFAWIIDPIDGSAPFYWNIPTWCISIGITRNFQPYMGFVYVPFTGDLYYSVDNLAYLNGNVIGVDSKAEISSDSAFCLSTRAFNYFSFMNYDGMIFALGSGIFNNMLVAKGAVIGALSISPSVWDLAAAVKIVKASGADMVYLTGEQLDIGRLHESRIATHPVLAAPSHLIETLLAKIVLRQI